jgi:hypothetical protein
VAKTALVVVNNYGGAGNVLWPSHNGVPIDVVFILELYYYFLSELIDKTNVQI